MSTAPNTDQGRNGRVDRTDHALLDALADPQTYPGRPAVMVRETHASWVFLAGERAYKVKKSVDLGFLDYSTLELRRAACREEVRVNQELAPGIYLAVRAIRRTRRGWRFADEDDPSAVEYAVKMRRFSEADTLAGVIAAGALAPGDVEMVARRLAAFHLAAPVVDGGAPGEVRDAWLSNVSQLRAWDPARLLPGDDLRHFPEAFVRAHADELQARVAAGLIRDGHGDLRCEHVLVKPTVRVVDRIEFDPRLRHADVAADLAFLAMDLIAHGRPAAAEELVDAYRRAGGDPGGDALLSFYMAQRALVRAKVAMAAAGQRHGAARAAGLAEAQRLSALAERLRWRARRPLGLVVCGPAASGKSVVADELASRTGLRVVSSDVLRKQLAGLRPTERGGPKHYTERFTRATYDLLAHSAATRCAADGGVIIDATCRTRAQRALLRTRLRRAGVEPLFVECRVPLAVASERAARREGRAGEVSDATPAIVAEQFASFERLNERPALAVAAVDTRRPLPDTIAAVARAVDRRLGRGHAAPAGRKARGRRRA